MEVVYIAELDSIYLVKEAGYDYLIVEDDEVEGKFGFKTPVHTLPDDVVFLGDL